METCEQTRQEVLVKNVMHLTVSQLCKLQQAAHQLKRDKSWMNSFYAMLYKVLASLLT